MPSNIEIKAKVRGLDRLRSIATRIATKPCQILHQEDVFFRAQAGRLKLDELVSGHYPLDRINEAIEESEKGDIIRNIIMF